jgi:hypothetical protein
MKLTKGGGGRDDVSFPDVFMSISNYGRDDDKDDDMIFIYDIRATISNVLMFFSM